MRDLLTHLGYHVQVANDGREGIECYNHKKNFDLVITDIRMPRMDGIEVAQYIRNSDRPDVPIIGISGYTDDPVNKELFDHFLNKPFGLEALKDAVSSLIQ